MIYRDKNVEIEHKKGKVYLTVFIAGKAVDEFELPASADDDIKIIPVVTFKIAMYSIINSTRHTTHLLRIGDNADYELKDVTVEPNE